MRMLDKAGLRLRSLFRRGRVEAELDAELRFHLDQLTEENLAAGMDPEEALASARHTIGGITQIQEECRDMRRLDSIEDMIQDLRHAVRRLLRTPGFTAVAMLTLGLGIGATTAIFGVVNGVLLKPLPYPEPGRLVSIAHTADLGSAPFLYFTETEQGRAFDGVGAYNSSTASVTGRGEPEQVQSLIVTKEILPILGIQPQLGRSFTAADDSPGSPGTVVLAYGYWQRRFGGDASLIGESLTIDGRPTTVIGVMPQRFRFLDRDADLILPFRLDRSQVRAGNFFLVSIARLRPGVTIEQATADVTRMIPIAIDSFPPIPGFTRAQMHEAPFAPRLTPLKREVVGDAGNTLWVLMGIVGIVLLIACFNVANLVLVRTEGRRQELSVRAALGAGWGRIAREVLIESAVLSVAGAALGTMLAYSGVQVLRSLAPANLPRLEEIAIDPKVLGFALGASILSGLISGGIPVIRYASPRLATAMRSGDRSASETRGSIRGRGVLVVVQVAMALVALISAGLMIRTFGELRRVDPGFSGADEIQTVQLNVPFASAPDAAAAARRQREILNRLAAIPGVASVAFTSRLPMGGTFSMTDLLFPEGKAFTGTERPKARDLRFISPGLFETMRIPLIAGRDLTWTDIEARRPVVLISRNLARAEWGSPAEALGKRLRGSSANDAWREIVGVVGDVREVGLSEPAGEFVYLPVLLERMYDNPLYVWRSLTYMIRSPRTGTPGFVNEIQEAVWAVDANMPLIDVRPLGEVVDRSIARTSFTLVLLAIAGTMALMLGLIGIYSVISYAVFQRRREIGIRLALGAQPGKLRGMFVRHALLLAMIGAAVGLAAAAGLTRLMTSLLFGVSPMDPLTYAVVAAVLVAAAMAASYLPARRAAAIDPVEALRSE